MQIAPQMLKNLSIKALEDGILKRSNAKSDKSHIQILPYMTQLEGQTIFFCNILQSNFFPGLE